MDASIKDLAQRLKRANCTPIQLHQEKLGHLQSSSLYALAPDTNALQTRPWRNLPKYFTQVLISAVALVKMSVHAKAGGSIEVMGMLTGKIARDMFIVMDVYSLPVEGTETRVNAQSEAYEYMVQYLDLLKEVDRRDSIIGWYHLHPGYGCWLSGIDVATQSLNQSFQDPYLAIVVDPVQTVNQNKVEIGAFRAFPVGYQSNSDERKVEERDYGVHSNQYYSLDIKLYKGPQDGAIMDAILNQSQLSKLLKTTASETEYQKNLAAKMEELMRQHMLAPSALVKRNLLMFNLRYDVIVGDSSSHMKDIMRAYFGLAVSSVDDPDMAEESDELKQDMGQEIEEDEDSEQTDRSDFASDSRKLPKRNLLGNEAAGIYFEAGAGHRKRFAAGDGAVDNELKHRMQSLQLELKKKRLAASNVGHAELLRVICGRARQRVFGVQ